MKSPVSFSLATALACALVTAACAQTDGTPTAPAAANTTIGAAAPATTATTAPAAPATTAPATAATTTPAAAAATGKSAEEIKADANAAEMAHYYYGMLQLRTDRKITGPINAQYILVGASGQLLALVDLNNVIPAKPIAELLDKQVKIYGVTHATPNFPFAMVTAQSVQLN